MNIREISLVGNPAFQPSEWIILKALATTYSNIAFSGNPIRPWHHIENMTDQADDLAVLVTSVLLQPGDPIGDSGETWDKESIETIAQLFAKRYTKKARLGQSFATGHYLTYKGEPEHSPIMAFGVTPDKPLLLYNAGDVPIPANSFFIQALVSDDIPSGTDNGLATAILNNKKIANGLRIEDASVLLKGQDGFPDEDEIDPVEMAQELSEILTSTLSPEDLDKLDMESLGESLVQIIEAPEDVRQEMVAMLAEV